MSEQWSVPTWALVALGATALLLVGSVLLVAALLRVVASGRRDTAALLERLDELESRLEAPPEPGPRPTEDREYLITHLGEEEPVEPTDAAPVVPAPVFADLVLRETVVQAATLAAGLRRALSPENRNRIRFEMRREVKRARKQRRLDDRTARREWEARQRAALAEDPARQGREHAA